MTYSSDNNSYEFHLSVRDRNNIKLNCRPMANKYPHRLLDYKPGRNKKGHNSWNSSLTVMEITGAQGLMVIRFHHKFRQKLSKTVESLIKLCRKTDNLIPVCPP